MKVALDKIRENPVALRSVNRDSETYRELVKSIRENGLLSPITVRQTDGPFFELIDGLLRFSACKDAGILEIDVVVHP